MGPMAKLSQYIFDSFMLPTVAIPAPIKNKATPVHDIQNTYLSDNDFLGIPRIIPDISNANGSPRIKIIIMVL